MKRFSLLLILAGAAFAGPIQMEIFPMLGPESGPNFDIWAVNVIHALLTPGPPPAGLPASPTDVRTTSLIAPRDIAYSPGGESWRGVFGVPGQTGSVLYFPVRIWSTDVEVTFTLNDVEFRQYSSDASNWWGWPDRSDTSVWDALILPGDTFTFYRVGRAADAGAWGAAGTLISANTWGKNIPISALYWIGVPGGGLWAEDPGPGQTLEDMLNQAILDIEAIGRHRATTNYRILVDEGGGDVVVSPEPAAWVLAVLGFGLFWAGRRRRR